MTLARPIGFLHCRSAHRILVGGAVVGLLALVGCGDKTEPGGPGSVRFAGKEPAGPKLEDWFRLTVPKLPTAIPQGGNADVVFGIERGQTFDQEVVLNFGDLPNGVTFAPPQPLIHRDQPQISVRFSTAADTPAGTATVKVAGNPMHGPEAESLFKIRVEKAPR